MQQKFTLEPCTSKLRLVWLEACLLIRQDKQALRGCSHKNGVFGKLHQSMQKKIPHRLAWQTDSWIRFWILKTQKKRTDEWSVQPREQRETRSGHSERAERNWPLHSFTHTHANSQKNAILKSWPFAEIIFTNYLTNLNGFRIFSPKNPHLPKIRDVALVVAEKQPSLAIRKIV